MQGWIRGLVLAAAVSAAGVATAQTDEAELKRDAVSRVVESHDPALSVGIGNAEISGINVGRPHRADGLCDRPSLF